MGDTQDVKRYNLANLNPPIYRNNTHSSSRKFSELFDSYFYGKYSFDDFLSIDISKETKKIQLKDNKIIYSCSGKLKNIHRFINIFIINKLCIKEDIVFSYRAGKNVVDTILPHSENKFFLQTDIYNFFPSISINLIKETILRGISNLEITDIDDYVDYILKLITIDNSLPIGFSSSPPMSNSCLYDIDNKISIYCEQKRMKYTRYADDLIISSMNLFDVNHVKNSIAKILNEQKNASFILNERKTKFFSKSQKIKMLGVVILPTGRVTVDIKMKKKVESMIYFYLNDKDKLLDLSGLNYEDTLKNISGLLNHINTIDKKYLDKLRMKYGNTVVDMFFHKSVK
ncbi:Retron-type reverse transcriptase [Yersinia frederiksenii]|nr:Retron-type reverse transcriptase [Yersinia frederiksenii]